MGTWTANLRVRSLSAVIVADDGRYLVDLSYEIHALSEDDARPVALGWKGSPMEVVAVSLTNPKLESGHVRLWRARKYAALDPRSDSAWAESRIMVRAVVAEAKFQRDESASCLLFPAHCPRLLPTQDSSGPQPIIRVARDSAMQLLHGSIGYPRNGASGGEDKVRYALCSQRESAVFSVAGMEFVFAGGDGGDVVARASEEATTTLREPVEFLLSTYGQEVEARILTILTRDPWVPLEAGACVVAKPEWFYGPKHRGERNDISVIAQLSHVWCGATCCITGPLGSHISMGIGEALGLEWLRQRGDEGYLHDALAQYRRVVADSRTGHGADPGRLEPNPALTGTIALAVFDALSGKQEMVKCLRRLLHDYRCEYVNDSVALQRLVSAGANLSSLAL